MLLYHNQITMSTLKSKKIREYQKIRSPHVPPNGQTPVDATNITNK